MKVRITSDGTGKNTTVTDVETGKPVEGCHSFNVSGSVREGVRCTLGVYKPELDVEAEATALSSEIRHIELRDGDVLFVSVKGSRGSAHDIARLTNLLNDRLAEITQKKVAVVVSALEVELSVVNVSQLPDAAKGAA